MTAPYIDSVATDVQKMCFDTLNQACDRHIKGINSLPSVTPKQSFINKSCISEGICHEDKVNVLDKIRAEIIELRTRQNVGVLECLDIIDEYIAESEVEE